jgi:hypothetical protein
VAHCSQLNQESSPESGPPCVPGRPHNDLSKLSGRRVRDSRSPDLGRLCRCTAARWRNR